MRRRGLLFGTVAFGGCELLRQLGAPTPTVALNDVRFSELDLRGVTLLFNVRVKNPYAVDLPIAGMEYALATSRQPFLRGAVKPPDAIPARGERVVPLPARLVFRDLIETVATIRPGAVVPYHASVTISVDAPSAGVVRLPIETEGELPVPAAPDVSVPSIAWESVTASGARGTMKMRIGNPNAFPIDLSKLEYALHMAGSPVVEGSTAAPRHIGAGSSEDLQVGLALSSAALGSAVLSALRSSSAQYALTGKLGVGTRFGPLQVPFEKTGVVSLGT